MGLSGVKKRSKISQDPNNTTWSKSTTTFGHKILSKQGWKPGEYLGAENATHSEHYTAANASHIRVLLREDNLGLGAQIGKGNAETFGLSMFSGLLGRLNGKSDGEVQKQQDAIRDVELRAYAGQKLGFMNFVSGGLLVGDKIEPPKSKSTPLAVTSVSEGEVEALGKKRKASNDEEEKAHRKNKKRKSDDTGSDDPVSHGSSCDRKSEKKSKSKRKNAVSSDNSSASEAEESSRLKDKRQRKEQRKVEKAAKSSKACSKDETAQLKEEKRARKEERRKRREEKQKRRAAKESVSKDSVHSSIRTSEAEGTATPSILQIFSGRQAVRQRYIQQKRMASMDPKALKEIFMMQAQTAG